MIEEWYGPDRRYSTQMFNWAFFERNPEPSMFMGLKDGEKLIGTQAVLPMQLRRGTELLWSAKSEETLVDSNYRGKGLFYKIFEEVFDHIDPRIDVLWGATSATKPFVPVSTRNHETPFGVRARIVWAAATPPLLIHCLLPEMLYPTTLSPSMTRSARVCRCIKSLPAAASVAP